MTALSTHSIRYGSRDLTLSWPDSVDVTAVGRRSASNGNTQSVLSEAIAHHVHAPSLRDFLEHAEYPLVVVNDATRSTPTAAVLELMLPTLKLHPHWRAIVATGLHRAPTGDEMAQIFGGCLPNIRDRILIHDGRDENALIRVESPAGPVFVNSVLNKADRLILINSVEPHFFAGFTGGRKSLIPGLAGYKTVEQSHAGAVSPASAPLRVRGNPVREYIERATQVVPKERLWAFQVVLDAADEVVAAIAGDVDSAFARACSAACEYYTVPIESRFDIVLAAVHPPLDLNLYQMQKGWELCQAAVRDGGALIVTSPCLEGVGSPFYQRLSEEFPNQDDWLALAGRPYTMGLHKLVRTGRMRQRCRLMAVTNMSPVELQRFGYEPFGDINEAIAAACAQVGKPARALVVHDAALTTMTIRNDEHK
ncbi:MAG: nickel-dependent lactate racemase [Candidatus Zixiibacteriota bacterium]